MINWTADSIWTARGKWVVLRDGLTEYFVNLYSDGWMVGPHKGLDIWTACRVLNDGEARLKAA